ncbi:MAG: redoxin family protein [Byssovorax sp.]
MTKRALLLVFMAALASCAPPPRAPSGLPQATLLTSGGARQLAEIVRPGRVTVIVFFSADCPCQAAHDARLRDLSAAYAARGVDILAVDSEAGASPERSAKEARARAYPFPLLADPEGALADALGAEFATYTVVLDAKGSVRYRGGLDSDRAHLTKDASLWVRNAVDRLLAGGSPDPAQAEALGCALRRS